MILFKSRSIYLFEDTHGKIPSMSKIKGQNIYLLSILHIFDPIGKNSLPGTKPSPLLHKRC